jgi:hypothetical protein
MTPRRPANKWASRLSRLFHEASHWWSAVFVLAGAVFLLGLLPVVRETVPLRALAYMLERIP